MNDYTKIRSSLAYLSVLFLCGCTGSMQDKALDQAVAQAPSNYGCESGETITVRYSSTDSATVRYKGNSYDMRIAISGSGARYIGDRWEWWTKGSGTGSEGSLFRHLEDGTSGDVVESCTEN